VAEPFDWALVRQAIEECKGGIPEGWVLVLPTGTTEAIVDLAEQLVDRDVGVGDVPRPIFLAKAPPKPRPDLTGAALELYELLKGMLGLEPSDADIERIKEIVQRESPPTQKFPPKKFPVSQNASHSHGVVVTNNTAPPKGIMGQVIHEKNTGRTMVYDGTQWKDITSGTWSTSSWPSVIYVLAGNHQQYNDYIQRHVHDPLARYMEVRENTLRGVHWNAHDSLAFVGTWAERRDLRNVLRGLAVIGCPADTIVSAQMRGDSCECPACMKRERAAALYEMSQRRMNKNQMFQEQRTPIRKISDFGASLTRSQYRRKR
jgi:hypothetical protein